MLKLSRMIVPLALVLALAACAAPQPTPTPEPKPKVALIISQGGLGDRGYNDMGHSGLQRAEKDLDIEVKTIESADPLGEAEQLLRTAAEAGFDVVITLEYGHFDALDLVAPDYPDTLLGIINIAVEQPNVVSVVFKEHEATFLAGALSAMVTTMADNDRVNPEKVIGFIGGTKSAGIDKFLVGFEEGAHYIDPEVEVLVAYSESFGDPGKGKELALAMYEQGADIIYQVAGGTGEGVFEAAEDTNHYAIGAGANQDYIKPGHILTSVMKRTDNAVYNIIAGYVAGEDLGGVVIRSGLAEGGMSLSPMEYTAKDLPQSFLDKIDELHDRIVNGEIVVTDITEQ